jgi:hypothetical protein
VPGAGGPVRPECAVGRTGHWILGNAHGGGEEAGHEVDVGVVRGGDDDAPRIVEGLQRREVRLKGAHGLRALKANEIVPSAPAHLLWRHAAQAVEQGRGRIGRPDRIGGEVHPNPFVVAPRREAAARGVEARRRPGGDHPLRPEHVRAGQGGVAAQVDLVGGGKPAQPIRAVVLRTEKGRFRQVHLAGDALHPVGVRTIREQAHGGRVSGEGRGGERIHLVERNGHGRRCSVRI